MVAEHQQFDELLLSFSVWIKLFLSELQTTSEISVMGHEAALTRHKVKCVKIEDFIHKIEFLNYKGCNIKEHLATI